MIRRRNPLNSIRWRFILINIAIVIIAFAFISMLTSQILEDQLLSEQIGEGTQLVNDLSVDVAGDLADKNAGPLYETAIKAGREFGGRVIITNEIGSVLVDTFATLNGEKPDLRETREVLSGTRNTSYGFHKIHSEKNGDFWAAYFCCAVVQDNDIIGSVLISKSIAGVVDKIVQIQERYYLIFIFTLLVMLALSYFSTTHISRPLEQLRESAIEISRGNFSRRIRPRGRDEIAELGETFNYMADKLENIDQNRREFVSNASHELKTPLTSIKILTESILYQDGVSEEVYKDFLGDINKEIDRLTNLINDLLLMTKVENDVGKLETTWVSLDGLAQEAVDMVRPLADKKSIAMVFEGDGAEAECDPMRIRQALNNLIDNAVKYTQEGGEVRVCVETVGTDAVVTVKDNGVGMSAEHLDKIFDRFYRVDKARARETGGTGLGLHLVQRIAHLHHGRVEVESRENAGSTFRLVIPLKQKTDGSEEG